MTGPRYAEPLASATVCDARDLNCVPSAGWRVGDSHSKRKQAPKFLGEPVSSLAAHCRTASLLHNQLIWIAKGLVAVDGGVLASLTVSEKLEGPATVGVPLIKAAPLGLPQVAPVSVLRVKPAGKEPVADQVYGVTPPVAYTHAV